MTMNTYCSFCGKSQHEVGKLIAGPDVFICDECVDLCADIIREEREEKAKAKQKTKAMAEWQEAKQEDIAEWRHGWPEEQEPE